MPYPMGAGAGRVIDAVDGTVAITGEDGIMVSGTFGSGLTYETSAVVYAHSGVALRCAYQRATKWQ